MRRPSLVGPVAPQRPPRSRTSPPPRRSARSAFVASAESPWLVTAMVCLRCPPPDAGPPDRQALPGAKPVRVTKYISEANGQVPTVSSSIAPAGALQTKEDQRVPASFDDDATARGYFTQSYSPAVSWGLFNERRNDACIDFFKSRNLEKGY
jgi:hypothetical protein